MFTPWHGMRAMLPLLEEVYYMNLLNLIQNEISPDAIGQIGSAVGESTDKTKSALSTAFPALLGSLVGKSATSPNGPADIMNMLKQGQNQGGWPDSVGKLLGSQSGGSAQAANHSLLSSLLGSKLGAVTDFISNRSGIRSGSATSLLGMAAPFLMGTIGKQVASQGLGVAGLGQLLSSQAQHVKDALPSGLSDTLGINHLLPGTHDTERVTAPKTAEPYGRPVEPAHATGGNALKWAWVPVLLALIGWFVARNHRTANEMGSPGVPVATETAIVHSTRLPDFSNLNLAPGGIADNIAKTISSGDLSKSIDLQGVSFDSSGAVADSAKKQFQDISSVLSAAPNVKVQITGYGESEDEGLNRANSVKNALTSAGVSADRVTTRGQTGSGSPTLNLMQ